LKTIRANIHRDIVGKVSSITITRNAAGKYYASILADDGQEAATKATYITAVAGYDLGLSHYLIGMVWICGKTRLQSGVCGRPPGQTGAVVCQLENLSLLRSQDAGNATKIARMEMPRL
jgi:hypothetical protein